MAGWKELHFAADKYTDADAISAQYGIMQNVRVRLTSNQSIAHLVETTILFDTEDVDENNLYNPATGKITIPENGNYLFFTNVLFDTNFVDQKTQWIGIFTKRDGVTAEIAHTEGQSSGIGYMSHTLSCFFNGEADDEIWIKACHTKGSSHHIYGVNAARTIFQMIEIGKG